MPKDRVDLRKKDLQITPLGGFCALSSIQRWPIIICIVSVDQSDRECSQRFSASERERRGLMRNFAMGGVNELQRD